MILLTLLFLALGVCAFLGLRKRPMWLRLSLALTIWPLIPLLLFAIVAIIGDRPSPGDMPVSPTDVAR
jgi:hypothetical protein